VRVNENNRGSSRKGNCRSRVYKKNHRFEEVTESILITTILPIGYTIGLVGNDNFRNITNRYAELSKIKNSPHQGTPKSPPMRAGVPARNFPKASSGMFAVSIEDN